MNKNSQVRSRMLKHVCSLMVGGCLALSTVTMAQVPNFTQSGPRGFSNENVSNISTVAGVFNNAYDGHFVTLQGRLTEYLGHERYMFSDATGSIEVELDDDHDWSYLSKDELIKIVGIVDSGLFSTKIEVKQAFSLENSQEQPRSASPVSHRDYRKLSQ